MDAIILAGAAGNPHDPLFPLTSGKNKALLSIAGKPMVQWVLDAVTGSRLINEVVLIGVDESATLTCGKKMHRLPDGGDLITNIQQGAKLLDKLHPRQSHILSFSGDIPGITSAIIDEVAAIYQKLNADICYSVVEKNVMETRYPGSKRTYLKLKDGAFCGGDMNAFSKRVALNPGGLWGELIHTRKDPLKQAGIIGWTTLALLLLGQLTLDDAAHRVCVRLGITGKAVIVPYAEIGMDVDKPFQFSIMEKDLMR